MSRSCVYICQLALGRNGTDKNGVVRYFGEGLQDNIIEFFADIPFQSFFNTYAGKNLMNQDYPVLHIQKHLIYRGDKSNLFDLD